MARTCSPTRRFRRLNEDVNGTRRLVLNDLCEEAKTCLRKGAITLSQAEALTLGSEEQQCGRLAECDDDISTANPRAYDR